LPVPAFGADREVSSPIETQIDDPANGGIRREPELPQHEEIVPEQAKPAPEFAFGEDDPDDDAVRARVLRQQARGLARQAALDPGDGMQL
jgi:type IV secretion system protein VirD4